jgi:hypothetical protein
MAARFKVRPVKMLATGAPEFTSVPVLKGEANAGWALETSPGPRPWFVADSALEQRGFELPVPPTELQGVKIYRPNWATLNNHDESGLS